MSDSPSPDPVPPDVPTVVDPFRSNQLCQFIGECFNVMFELPLHVARGHLYQHGKINLSLLVKSIVSLVVIFLTVFSVLLVAYIVYKILALFLSLHLLVSSVDFGGLIRRFFPIACHLLKFISPSALLDQVCSEQFTEIIIDEAEDLLAL